MKTLELVLSIVGLLTVLTIIGIALAMLFGNLGSYWKL